MTDNMSDDIKKKYLINSMYGMLSIYAPHVPMESKYDKGVNL